MALVIKDTKTQNTFPIKEGYKIGRTKGDIVLNDPKVSSLHAEVRKNERDQLVLTDMKSSNGIKINGQKVPRIILLPGVKFQIGKSLFKVEETEDMVLAKPTVKINPNELKGWQLALYKTEEAIKKLNFEDRENELKVFEKPVSIEAIEGPLKGWKQVFTFGPRVFGFECGDIDLKDNHIPGQAFQLTQVDGAVLFLNSAGRSVKINHSVVEQSILKSADKIQIGPHVFEVSIHE